METVNPYSSPGTIRVDRGQAGLLKFHHYIWCGITLLTAILWAIFPIEELPVRRLIQSSQLVSIILMLSPAIYWEAFCRKTPRSEKWLDSLSSSFLRCWFVYLMVFLVGSFLFSKFAGPMWSNGDAPMTPAMKVMYAKHGFASASSVFLASAVVIMFDRWRSVRVRKGTEQSVGHGTVDDAGTNGLT